MRTNTEQTHRSLVIVGGGHVGLMTALLTHLRAVEQGETINITIYEKNDNIHQTTAANIWNSHTDDEIASVVPRGAQLGEKLAIPFNEPGGIKVSDVPGVNDSESAQRFIQQVIMDGKDNKAYEKRESLLLALGHAGMAAWKRLRSEGPEDLRKILEEANFNPCCENDGVHAQERFNGYRIDLIYSMSNANAHAQGMVKTYTNLGYKRSQILTPDEVEARDGSLAHFCAAHSEGVRGSRTWKDDSSAVWRPGGCLDTQRFLPQLVAYLEKSMGTYKTKEGVEKPRFSILYNKQVTGVNFTNNSVESLVFADGTKTIGDEMNKTTYVFAPGESVGTIRKLGFAEPAYAGFAGASLSLEVPLPEDGVETYRDFNHYMEVHRPGTVLAWQARLREGKLFLGGAGTKAFYGDVVPTLDDDFAREKNLLQLNMFNDVLPDVVSLALGRDVKGQTLGYDDLHALVEKNVAKRWVGRRAVVYDGFPTVGHLYRDEQKIENAQVITHLGSGGGSFSVIMALVSNYAVEPEKMAGELAKLGLDRGQVEEILHYADSRREAREIPELEAHNAASRVIIN